MKAQAPDTTFKFFPQLNKVEDKKWMHSTSTFGVAQYEMFFSDESLQSKLLKSLSEVNLLPIKEVLEMALSVISIRIIWQPGLHSVGAVLS